MDVFDLVAKIRLDSSEYEQGVGKAKGTFSTLASGVKTGLATVAKVGAAAVTAGVAGVTALTKMGIENYKQYEQLAGGAELLWGNAYDFIADKASAAYMTVQMSENEYLQQVNGFSTGLKTALGGNEQAAAELADRIITAEADIVAATGNTQENVQNAFNGIMKSNFTMLDNLQLGITPTKEGFQEMINKVNEWNTANGEATNYQISNLADCQSALLDYIEMQGLSGYAAMEASNTIEGSLSMVKASWQNLVTALAADGWDLGVYIENFIGTVKIAAEKLLPVIKQTLMGIGDLITALAPIIAEALPVLVESVLPSLLTAGVSLITALVNGVITALPALYTALLDAVQIILVEVFGVSEEKAGEFADGINSFFVSIKDGFVWLVETAQTEGTLLNQVWEALQTTFQIVKDALVIAFDAVKNAFTWCAEQINTDGTWLNETWEGIKEAVQAWFDYISALFDAVSAAFTWCVEQINTEGTVLNAIWDFLCSYVLTIWENIKIGVSAYIDILKNYISIFTSVLRGDWSGAWEAIKNICETVWNAICDTWSNVASWFDANVVQPINQYVVQPIVEYFTGLWNSLVSVWDWICGTVESAFNFIVNIVTFAFDLITLPWRFIWENCKEYVFAAFEWIKEKISIASEWVANKVEIVWGWIRDNIVNPVRGAYEKAVEIFNNIKEKISEKITATKDKVTEIFKAIKEKIQTPIQEAKQTLSDTLDSIKKKFTDIFNGCKKIVTDALDAIKKAFDFEWSLPGLKLPHISVTGGVAPYGIGGKGSLPSFGIEWYKKAYDNAMILSSPTIFGYSNGKFLGGGDGNGNEVVAGESYLMNMIGDAVAAQNGQVVRLLSALLEATVDGNGEMVRALMADKTFAVGEREFARLVRTYA